DQPQLGIALRGICALQVDVRGANSDLHSGSYGGAVQNPIHALVRLLDSMRDPEGRIRVQGFYDAVRPLTAEDRTQIAAVPFDEAEYKAELGVDALFGEPEFTPRERLWARPTLEINGIWGGFQGLGTKTVIPNEAHAKITCRLVPDQEPEEIAQLVIAHVRRNTPPGVRVTARSLGGGARPYLIPASHPGNRLAHEVLTELYGLEPYYTRSGGTIAMCDLLLQHLGAHTVSFGFGLRDERFHAPNEFFRISSFRRGQEAYALLLHRLGERGLKG
ncbi:MAG: M20 family dipeptidase, partial [Chloroflexi bacterium]|nr:M20 family dipeptidase [Chloroflexota bacterium]